MDGSIDGFPLGRIARASFRCLASSISLVATKVSRLRLRLSQSFRSSLCLSLFNVFQSVPSTE